MRLGYSDFSVGRGFLPLPRIWYSLRESNSASVRYKLTASDQMAQRVWYTVKESNLAKASYQDALHNQLSCGAWSRVYDSNVFRWLHRPEANHTASLLLAAPVGVEPTNERFKAVLLYQFAYSAIAARYPVRDSGG